jgi:pimeloyl-ACP methyl ester carboxylesterase
VTREPIPHWPGELIDLGDHQVFVRSVPAEDPAEDHDEDHDEDHGAEPALCVHGLAGSSRNWTDLMDLLRPRLACAALDLPGFGDSPPRPDGRYSIAALAQTVAALIERNQIERNQIERQQKRPVHLIANSLGGAVSVRLAATRPDLVQTLTLISPALPDSRPRLDLVRFPVMSLPRLGARLLRKYQTLPPQARVADVITTCYADPALFPPARFNAEVTELARRDTLDYATDAMVGSIRALTAEAFRAGRHAAWRDAARITVPTLVIYGSHDRLVLPRMAGRAAQAFSGARIVVLPRTGHVAHMENPARVAAEIGVLLEGIPARADRLTVARAGQQAATPVR